MEEETRSKGRKRQNNEVDEVVTASQDNNHIDGRIPPQDIVAEKSLLGAMMLSDNGMADVLTVIRPDDFYDKRHREIFAAMMELYDSHQPIDLLSIRPMLRMYRLMR